MKIKERNAIIAIISFVVGVFLLIFIIPELIVNAQYYLSQAFTRLYGYYTIDLFILAMILFFYAYFLLKPLKTLRGKKILALGAVIFGGILIFFLIGAIGFELNYRFFYGYGFDVIDSLNIILCIVILIPGITLLIHGWFLKKLITSEEKRKLLEMKIKERNAIIAFISFVVGVFLLICIILTLNVIYPYYILITYPFSRLYGYLYLLDLIILDITLFLYAYFLIKPIKTLRGKKIIPLGIMIFGGILFILPIITISFDIYFYGYSLSLVRILDMILYLVLLLPGLPLSVHGWYLKRSTVSEER